MKAKTVQIMLSLAIATMFFGGCMYFDPPIDGGGSDQDYDTESGGLESCDSSEDSTARCNGNVLEFCTKGYWSEWLDCDDEKGTCWVESDGSWGECQ